jgi:hypothetical protein
MTGRRRAGICVCYDKEKAMAATGPRYSKEEFAQRGDAFYEREIRPLVEPESEGQYVAIDIDSGAFAVAADELTACDRLLERVPDAQVWLRRVGRRHVRRFGGARSVLGPA